MGNKHIRILLKCDNNEIYFILSTTFAEQHRASYPFKSGRTKLKIGTESNSNLAKWGPTRQRMVICLPRVDSIEESI